MTWAYDAIRWLSSAMTRGNSAPLRWHDTALKRRDIVLGPQSAAQKLQSTLLKSQSAKGVLV